MANWQFTDQYGTAYPVLNSTILSTLVFDVPNAGDSPISGTTFNGTLDLAASGKSLSLLSALTGLSTIAFTGTVTNSNNTLTVALASSDNTTIAKAFSANFPIVGSLITTASLSINTGVTTAMLADDIPTTDSFGMSLTVTIGSATGTLTTQVPMSKGFFNIMATFKNAGISLSDLNFLVPGSNDFTSLFPSTELGPYYNANSTKLELLELGLSIYINPQPSLKMVVSGVFVSIGITNIPIYKQALYLDPLAVTITVSNVNTKPTAAWGLVGDFVLCNYNRPGDTDNPDFVFDLQMGFPNPPTQPNFSLSGIFENPYNQPVSQIVSDLLGQATDLGIGNTITIEKFDFSTDANVTTGTISDFEFEIAMSGQFGIFENLSLESFSLAVAYSA